MRFKAPNETSALVYPGIELLGLLRIQAWRNNAGLACGESGSRVRIGLARGGSDIVGIILKSGRWLAAEAKMPGVKYANQNRWLNQWEFLNLINGYGGAAFVYTSLPELEMYARGAIDGGKFEVSLDGSVRMWSNQ